ncbi:MAG TPA: hypothetical protein VF613_19160 [Longimicrobium sp.]|jgi:hypothetical protein
MRSLLLAAAALLALPLSARAQSVGGAIGVSARILAVEEVRVGTGATAGAVKLERAAGGALRMSVPLLITHQARPVLAVQQRPGDPACELVEEGSSTRLRCSGAAGLARIVIVPNT